MLAATPDQHPDRHLLRVPHEVPEGKPGIAHPLVPGEGSGLHHHQPIEAVGVLDRQPQPDRPTPVVDDRGRPTQVEPLQQLGDQLDVAVEV